MIKTTKETHKQDETFKGNVTFNSYDNVYANVDGEMKSLPDYIASKGSAPSNMVTTDTEQHITGHKYFTKLSISNEQGNDNFDITTSIDKTTATNKVYFAREETSGYYRNEYVFKSGDIISNFISIVSGEGNGFIYVYSNGTKPEILYKIALPSASGTLATTDSINVITEAKLTLKSNQTYTCEANKPAMDYNYHVIIKLINNDIVHTSSFDITGSYISGTKKQSRTAFLMAYGTTSDDVATCFAYFDTDALQLNIDLDNCQLSTGYSVQAYYYKYN